MAFRRAERILSFKAMRAQQRERLKVSIKEQRGSVRGAATERDRARREHEGAEREQIDEFGFNGRRDLSHVG